MTTLAVFDTRIRNAERMAAAKFRACPWQFFDGIRDRHPNELLWWDYAVTRVMGSGIHRKLVPKEDSGATRKVNQLLSRIPVGYSIVRSHYQSGVYENVYNLFMAMRRHRIAMSRIAKVLCRKRPHLIPMLDSLVTGFLWKASRPWRVRGGRGRPPWFDVALDTWVEADDPRFYMRMIREAMIPAREDICSIRSYLASIPATGVPADAPLLRIWEATVFWHQWTCR